MSVRNIKAIMAGLFGLVLTQAALADDLLMARSSQSFPETMLMLQTSITEHGYKVSRVQRVDIGLTKSGFKTDKYRIVFLGKADEIARITAKHPEMIAYLPLKMVIFAEGEDTLLVTNNPGRYRDFFPATEFGDIFARWESDLRSILDDIREAQPASGSARRVVSNLN